MNIQRVDMRVTRGPSFSMKFVLLVPDRGNTHDLARLPSWHGQAGLSYETSYPITTIFALCLGNLGPGENWAVELAGN
jgi:hypothetical protein